MFLADFTDEQGNWNAQELEDTDNTMPEEQDEAQE